jgi:hypothetical protein
MVDNIINNAKNYSNLNIKDWSISQSFNSIKLRPKTMKRVPYHDSLTLDS